MPRIDKGRPLATPSTLGVVSGASTSDIIAEITDVVPRGGDSFLHAVTWLPGASMPAVFQLEHCASTNLADPVKGRVLVQVPAGMTMQYTTSHHIEPGDCLRMRVVSSLAPVADITGYISTEPVT